MPARTPPTKLLLRARRQALLNRLRALSSSQKTALVVALIALPLMLLWAGAMQRAGLLATPDATTLPAGFSSRTSLMPGAAALDMAFWTSAFCSAIFSFRIMELLFRDNAIRSVDNLPLPMRAYFVDRLVRGLIEAFAWGVPPALFFAPLALDAPWVALATTIMCLGGPLLTLGSGLGIQLFFGGSEFGKTQQADRKAVDGYGGAGQLFLFAPGAALAAAVVLVMLLKLSLGEMIRLESFNRATALGIGIGVVTVIVCLGLGWGHFKRAYFRMLAGFREADFVGFDLPIDYQISDFEKPRYFESLLPTQARLSYRRNVLQYGRRFALIRYMYGLLWLLSGVGLFQFEPEALPSWVIAALPVLLLSTLANPFVRLEQEGLRVAMTQPARLPASQEALASALFTARESLTFVLPFALITLVLAGWRQDALMAAGMSAGVMCAGALMIVVVAHAMRQVLVRPGALHYVSSTLSALALMWAATLGLHWALVCAGSICALALALATFFKNSSTPSAAHA